MEEADALINALEKEIKLEKEILVILLYLQNKFSIKSTRRFF